MTARVRKLIAAAFFLAMPALAEAQTVSPLAGVTISSPGSGQAAQNYSFLCSVSGCATGTVFPGVGLVQGNSILGTTNGIYSNLLQGNAVISATNGLFSNVLQGNAVLSATNGSFSNILQGNAVLSLTNPLFITPATSAGMATSALQTTGNTALNTINTTLGSPLQAGGNVAITSWGGSTMAAGTAPGVPQTTGLVPTFNVGNSNANLTPGDAITTTTYNAASPTLGSTLLWNGTTSDRWKEGVATGVGAVSFNATPSLANGNGVVPTQGGAVISVTNPGFTEITDGTHAAAATKAASTAAVAADPALVVALSPNNTAKIVGNAGGTLDTASGTAASTGLSVQGMSAAGATFSDAPMGNGLNAISTNPTVVTNGQKVKQMGDVQGKEINLPYSPAALANNGQGSSTTTAAITVQAASGSSLFKEYMTSLSCSRNDAGTTPINVSISDGTTTVVKTLPNAGSGGTVTWPFPVPRAWAANTAVTVTPSAGVTTLNCDATGFNAS